jgi:hypothetical protein
VVLFQMNAADSSHLLDSPLASHLGRNRALYMIDELGQPEKFHVQPAGRGGGGELMAAFLMKAPGCIER